MNEKKIAVIDVGTNTTRLLIKNSVTNEELKRAIRITGLGAELEESGLLGENGMQQTIDTIKEYVEQSIANDVRKDDIKIFATAACRNSENGVEFINKVKEITSCDAEIISGEQEGKFAFEGAVSGLEVVGQPCLVFDIGGGSTEFSISSKEDFSKCGQVVSIPIGSVRITKRHLLSDPPKAEELSNCISDIREHLKDVEDKIPNIKDIKKWIGVAATVTTTASIEIGLLEFDAKRIHQFVLTRSMVEDVFRTLATEKLEDRKHNPGLEPERADVIVGGVAIIVSIMRHFDLEEIQVSCTDLLDGLYLSMLSR